jgi:hypothetical protein
MGEYIPQAPVNEEARKRNGNLPGMGGVFNVVNLHVYHYAGNNPVKYVDPDGEKIRPPLFMFRQSDIGFSDADLGGETTFDDAEGAKRNTIGAFGCFFMAAISVGLTLKYMNSDGTYNTVPSESLDNPLSFNKSKYFAQKTPGGNGGTDVFLLDITSSIGSALKRLRSDSKNNLVIAEVKTDEEGGRHFIVLNGITIGRYSSIKLDYTEQYDGFSDLKFNYGDIVSLHVFTLE